MTAREGGRAWKIFRICQTAKEGGCGKYLVAAQQPRREDVANIHKQILSSD